MEKKQSDSLPRIEERIGTLFSVSVPTIGPLIMNWLALIKLLLELFAKMPKDQQVKLMAIDWMSLIRVISQLMQNEAFIELIRQLLGMLPQSEVNKIIMPGESPAHLFGDELPSVEKIDFQNLIKFLNQLLEVLRGPSITKQDVSA